MKQEPFRFTLEPERIAVASDRDELAARVARGYRAESEARAAAARAADELRASAGRIADFHAEETAGAAYDAALWTARSEHLTALQDDERRAADAFKSARSRARAAREVLANLVARLDETELALRSLEHERERQLRAWRRAEDRRAEALRDDEALLRWNHERRRGEEVRRHE